MSKVVKFLQDIYPYVRDDVVRLEADVLAEVDKVAKSRKLSHVYEEVKDAVDAAGDAVDKETAKGAKAAEGK